MEDKTSSKSLLKEEVQQKNNYSQNPPKNQFNILPSSYGIKRQKYQKIFQRPSPIGGPPNARTPNTSYRTIINQGCYFLFCFIDIIEYIETMLY